MIERLKPYSKAIAALVSAVVAALVAAGLEIDGVALEVGIIALLTAAGVFSAPANS